MLHDYWCLRQGEKYLRIFFLEVAIFCRPVTNLITGIAIFDTKTLVQPVFEYQEIELPRLIHVVSYVLGPATRSPENINPMGALDGTSFILVENKLRPWTWIFCWWWKEQR